MKKRTYESPNMYVCCFVADDVVRTSGAQNVETQGEAFFEGYSTGWW